MNTMQISLDPRASVGVQPQDIEWIQDAPNGAVLFSSIFLAKNGKDEDTLRKNNTIKSILSQCGIPFITRYHPENHTIQFVKEVI